VSGYTMKASAIPACADLLANRAQLKSRMAQLAGVSTLGDMLALLTGTGLEPTVLAQAKAAVAGFLKNGLDQIEAEIAALGIELDT
jgi:hypothetical protein